MMKMLKVTSLLVVLLLMSGRPSYCDEHQEEEVKNILKWKLLHKQVGTPVVSEEIDTPVEQSTEEADTSDESEEAPSKEEALESLQNSLMSLLGDALSEENIEKIKADIANPKPKPPQRGMSKPRVPITRGKPSRGTGARRMAMANGVKRGAAMPQMKSKTSAQAKINFWADKCTKKNPFCLNTSAYCLTLFPGWEAYRMMGTEAKKFLDCCKCHVNFQCYFPKTTEPSARMFS